MPFFKKNRSNPPLGVHSYVKKLEAAKFASIRENAVDYFHDKGKRHLIAETFLGHYAIPLNKRNKSVIEASCPGLVREVMSDPASIRFYVLKKKGGR